jgi:hypothetical protein
LLRAERWDGIADIEMLRQPAREIAVLQVPHERGGVQKADGRDAERRHLVFILASVSLLS